VEGGNGLAATPTQNAFMTVLAYDFMFKTSSKKAEKSADEKWAGFGLMHALF